ncbi:MAG: hypothetical protein ACTS10_12175 [Kiloniellales bacterium]
MNKTATHSARTAAALGVLAALSLTSLPGVAQDLPLVSRQLQFHTTPAERAAAAQQTNDEAMRVEVDLGNLPRVPLPAGTVILPPRIDSTTGAYLGPGGERGVVLPEVPVQQPREALPPLVVGQTYLPPWFDDIRNIEGGRGPIDATSGVGRGNGEVRPEDLRRTPPVAPGNGADETLPDEPPAAPLQRSAAPALTPSAPTPPVAPSARPAGQVAPEVMPQPVPQRVPPPLPQTTAAEVAPPAAPTARAQAPSPIPLVSRKLNFQY